MPNRRLPARPQPASRSFRVRYDALEQRRNDLIARLAALGERGQSNPAHQRARKLLNETFRKSSLAQRAGVLEAADWLIALIDRSTTPR